MRISLKRQPEAGSAAARRWCDVTATDYVPALLDRARERAEAERLAFAFREADAESLPFPGESFDVVVSTFGVMFTPDQEGAAAELIRVCKRGGKIGLANWTPEGFIGQLFMTVGNTCLRLTARSRPRGGERGPGSPSCWSGKPRRSRRPTSTSSSATARLSTGWRCSRPTTGRCLRRSPPSPRRGTRRWSATSWH